MSNAFFCFLDPDDELDLREPDELELRFDVLGCRGGVPPLLELTGEAFAELEVTGLALFLPKLSSFVNVGSISGTDALIVFSASRAVFSLCLPLGDVCLPPASFGFVVPVLALICSKILPSVVL